MSKTKTPPPAPTKPVRRVRTPVPASATEEPAPPATRRARTPVPASAIEESPMRLEMMALSDLKKWPRNPKLHAMDVIDNSITEFGYVQPLLIDERSGFLVAGHGRLSALEQKRLRGQEPPQRIAVREDGEWLVPVLRGVAFKDMKSAEAYLLADNRTVELGGWDSQQLARILTELDQDQRVIAGFDDAEVNRILAAADRAPIPAPDKFVQFNASDIKTNHSCPKCGYRWSDT